MSTSGAGSSPGKLLRWCGSPGIRGRPETAQEVEVRFTPEGSGTRMELIHSHWERLGDKAKVARRGYPIGWAYVLSLYADRHGPLVVTLDVDWSSGHGRGETA